MDRSQSFASAYTDLHALLKLAFATAPSLIKLNLASIAQLVGSLCKRHAVTIYSLRPLVSIRFQELFHSFNSRYFSPFPYGTRSLSVSEEYLALPDGAGKFTQDSSCPALLRILRSQNILHLRGFHSLWLNFPIDSIYLSRNYRSPITPESIPSGLGYSLFARHYSGNHFLFSLPLGT